MRIIKQLNSIPPAEPSQKFSTKSQRESTEFPQEVAPFSVY